MRALESQAILELMLGKREPEEDEKVVVDDLPTLAVIYFTASWCGACKKLDLDAIEASLPAAIFLKCDVDANTYSAGYCGVRSLPSFFIVKGKKPIGPFGNSNTEKVVDWLRQNGL